jgi:hypothetical protein
VQGRSEDPAMGPAHLRLRKPEGSEPASLIAPRHFRLPPSSRSASPSLASARGAANAITRHSAVKPATADECERFWNALNIGDPPSL